VATQLSWSHFIEILPLELLEMDKSGIAVAEFWTVVPPKAEFERKINEIMQEVKERLERRKIFPIGK